MVLVPHVWTVLNLTLQCKWCKFHFETIFFGQSDGVSYFLKCSKAGWGKTIHIYVGMEHMTAWNKIRPSKLSEWAREIIHTDTSDI